MITLSRQSIVCADCGNDSFYHTAGFCRRCYARDRYRVRVGRPVRPYGK